MTAIQIGRIYIWYREEGRDLERVDIYIRLGNRNPKVCRGQVANVNEMRRAECCKLKCTCPSKRITLTQF